MTIAQLIEKLQAFDPGLRAVTPGFDEMDIEDVDTVELVRVVFDDGREKFHGGRHKLSDAGVPAVKIDWQ